MQNFVVTMVFIVSFSSITSLPIKVSVTEESFTESDKILLTTENVYESYENMQKYSEGPKADETENYTGDVNKENNYNTFDDTEKSNNEAKQKRPDNEDIESININVHNTVRPGMEVDRYEIELKPITDDLFEGIATIHVNIFDKSTIGEPIVFHIEDLEIASIRYAPGGGVPLLRPRFHPDPDEGILTIFPPIDSTLYTFVIDYTGLLDTAGIGMYRGDSLDEEYIAMNLHPTNARRVFPCLDEPSLGAIGISFTFNDMGFDRVLTNSHATQDNPASFHPLQGPVHRWAMVAHSMNNINNPVPNSVSLYIRRGVNNQETQASVAINNYYTGFNAWTNLNHSEIAANQEGILHVLAVPDVSRDWYGLSTLCIWEPYILMENNNAVKQRKIALVTIAEGMARQWFGWRIFPENWRDQWVIAGLGSYAAYEIVRDFQTPPINQEDESLIDMNTIFTTDVIQESLLYDAYGSAQPLRLSNNIFDENLIRLQVHGLLKTKAPALMRMARLVLSRQADLVQTAAQGILRSRSSQAVTTRNFYDTLKSGYMTGAGSGLVSSAEDFLRPWVENSGYPFITVGLRQGGVNVLQERFGFSVRPQINYIIPLTFTTSANPNFVDIFPRQMLETNLPLDVPLGEGEWVIFNIQGQGYYRVNYEPELWERLIEALEDEESRDDIHPLNRAALLDDSLNLARAGRIEYDIPLQMALSMELETEYAVWKAYIRNMEFIRKRLEPFVEEDDDIYLRMVRRTIVAFEEEIGFEPDVVEPAMLSLTRGLVMEHACKSDYDPCVAVAVDMFFDPNNEEQVNRNIPPEIRPAVYCTMVREDEDDIVLEALRTHLEEVPMSRYERLVILESFACSEDGAFIQSLLLETISEESPYVVEERSKIFAAVASSSYDNSREALNFLIRNTQNIRNMYGGAEKLEEAIFVMAENIADAGQANDFINWINSLNTISNLDDSMLAAQRARDRVNENLAWVNNHLEDVYEWIDENDAPTVFASTFLLCLSFFVALLNQN